MFAAELSGATAALALGPGEALVWEGDCREYLASLPGNSADAVVTDPPYELGFMGQAWDRSGIAFDPAFWAEALRILKPGGHLLAAGIGRTHHRMMVAIEDAGFEVRDCIYHIFGSGFPKSLDISKAVDKMKGGERPVAGCYVPPDGGAWNLRQAGDPSAPGSGGMFTASGRRTLDVTTPATEEAMSWEGWGTSLKPAVEIWVLARKPLSEKSVAENVLKWGVGALNIDGCRISYRGKVDPRTFGGNWRADKTAANVYGDGWKGDPRGVSSLGRWPANLVLTHPEDCKFKGCKRVKGITGGTGEASRKASNVFGWHSAPAGNYADEDGMEWAEDWECVAGCPVREIDEQSGILKSGFMAAGTERSNLRGYRGAMPAATLRDTHGDSGGASRFFYCAKASRSERWGFCKECGVAFPAPEVAVHRAKGHQVVVHPTQKPLQLMRWLVRLVTPPGGLILDPFAGSGTTLAAAVAEGFRAVGCERDPEYAAIARARLAAGPGGQECERDGLGKPGRIPAVARQMRLPLFCADEGQG